MISEKGSWAGKEFTSYLIPTDSPTGLSPIGQIAAFCFNEDGKILLIKDPVNAYWGLPGGSPEDGETIEETLVREVMEEATCEIKPLSMIGAIKVNFPENPKLNEGEHFFQLRYVAKVTKVLESAQDPAKGRKMERIFVSPSEFLNYVTWTKEIGRALLNLAIVKINEK